MPDLIIKKQDIGNIAVSTTTQNVVIQAAPTNSYVLPPATANTLGGVIVGSNLSITGNGVLSANIPSGGVTAFNNRTGNVTLTANDVASLSFPLSSNLTVTSGEKRIRGDISGTFNGNGTYYPRDIYGITREGVQSNITYQYYMGVGYNGTLNPGAISTSGAAGIAVGYTLVDPNAATDYLQIDQTEFRINSIGSYLAKTYRSDVPPFTAGNMVSSILGVLQNSVSLQRTRSLGGTTLITSMEVFDGFITVRGDLKATSVKEVSDNTQYLTKYAADRLYQPLTRLN
jgi:hypothetical protein